MKNESVSRSKVQISLEFSMINRAERWAEAFAKLENPEFKKFLEGEMGYILPSESSLFGKNLPQIIEKAKQQMTE